MQDRELCLLQRWVLHRQHSQAGALPVTSQRVLRVEAFASSVCISNLKACILMKQHLLTTGVMSSTMGDVDIVERVKGMARHVQRVLGRGHSERVFQDALCTALRKASIGYRMQVACPIVFMSEVVGCAFADLIVEDVIIEMKAVNTHPHDALPQVRKYQQSLRQVEGREYRCLIINFHPKLGVVQFAEDPDLQRARREFLAEQAPKPLASLAFRGSSSVFRRSRNKVHSRPKPGLPRSL